MQSTDRTETLARIANVDVVRAKGRYQAVAYDAQGNMVEVGRAFQKADRAERDREVYLKVAQQSRRTMETRAVVAAGKCPHCGAGLRQNLSIAGWWQCAQYGAVGFRADANKPACGWQGFV